MSAYNISSTSMGGRVSLSEIDNYPDRRIQFSYPDIHNFCLPEADKRFLFAGM
jgi:hypothetical protein